jgi:hypothetical protein
MAVTWAGIFAGPAAWALDVGVSYSLVQWTCGGGPTVVLHLISAAALVAIGGGAFASWIGLQRAAGVDTTDGDRASERGRFMAMLGLVMCAFFAVVVIAAAVPRWVLDACHQ